MSQEHDDLAIPAPAVCEATEHQILIEREAEWINEERMIRERGNFD